MAVTLNQTTLEAVLYKNGEEVNRATLPSGLLDTSGEALHFGFSPSAADDFMNGNFSEVRMWNRVLSGAEIRQRMFTQATGKETGLVSAWSMDEGSGTTLGNRVAGGPTGAFQPSTAAPTWSTQAPPVMRQRQHEATAVDTAVVIALRGVDLDGDALSAKIKSLPASGTLFQYDGASAGAQITAVDTAVTDAMNRVVYVPGSGFTGTATLTFSMSDATLESADALLSVTVTATAITRETWSAGDDFHAIEKPDDADDTSNPNALVPEWSYGTRVGATGTAFTAFTPAQHSDTIFGPAPGWQGYNFPSFGTLSVNASALTHVLNFGSGNLQPFNPREILMHPGATGAGAALPVLRWTAPVAGNYAVDSTWNDVDRTAGNGIVANVVLNGTVVFSQTVHNTVATGFQVLTLAAGDVVDFVCGNNGDVGADSTTLVAKITRVRNVYDAGKAFTRMNGNPNGLWQYGAKPTATGVLTPYTLGEIFNAVPNWHFSTANFGTPLVRSIGPTFDMHPSSNTSPGFSTVRFTAPAAGRYRVAGSASTVAGGNGVTVHVVRDGTELSNTTVLASSSTRLSSTVALSAGQTLDLVVGANGAQNFDTTSVQMIVAELPAPQPSTLVHYRFEDGPASGAVGAMLDSGPYLLHGTKAGTLTHSTDRAANPETGSFSLDARGDGNYGQINDTALLHQQGDFTVEMFFKADAPYDQFGSPSFSTLATKLNTTAGGTFLSGFEINSLHDGQVGGVVSFAGSTGVDVTSTGLNTRDGQWHHVALVMDRDVSGTTDELRLYVDGVLQGSTQGTWPELFYGDQPLYLGAGNFAGTASTFRRNFDGHIDEFRISSAALTPAQMLSNLAPTAITLNDDKVHENRAAGEVVGTLGGTDPNPGDTLTIALVPGVGDTDNASFTIVGNELRTTAVFDYATQPAYAVRLRATDTAGKFFEQALTITVLDAPVLVLPASPFIAEATGPAGAVVTFTVTATDVEDDPDPIATAVPASGSTFSIGDTTVNVSATDLDGATTSGSFIVRVRDTTAPVVAAHANVTVAATSALGAVVTYAPGSATDAVTASPTITYSQDSGTAFPIGTTTVTITAADAATPPNVGTGTFTVTVTNNAPVVMLSGDNPLTFEAAATYSDPGATASDVEDGTLTPVIDANTVVANVPGAYAVTWKATDTASPVLSGTATRTVNVVDTTAPAIAPHANVAAVATSAAGAVVTYDPATATDVVGVTSITYSQDSGTTFPIGTTTVTITAKDAADNTSTRTFDVTISAPEIAIEQPAGTNLNDGTGSVDFGSRDLNLGIGRTFTIRNTGSETLNVGAITIDGAHSGDFAVTSLPAATVPAGGSTSFEVTFTPSATGARTAALHVANDDASENPFDLTLSGTGTDLPGALAFAAGTHSARPVNSLAQPNLVQVPITRTGGAGGAVTVTVEPSQPATVPSGFVKYVYGVDYEFVTGSAAGTTVNFADGQTSATVGVQLKTPVLTKKGQFKLTLSAPTGGATLGTITVCTVTIEARDATKPVITISPTIPSTVPATFTVAGTVKETGGGLSSFKIMLNGVEQTLTMNPVGSPLLATGAAFSATLTPENGSNRIIIEAKDLSGNLTGAIRTVTYFNHRPQLTGTYNAVLEATGTPDFDTTGLVNVLVTSTGTFTGKVFLSDVSVPFKGVIANSGVARFFGTAFIDAHALPVVDLLSNIGNDGEEHESYLGAIGFTIDETNGMAGTLQSRQTGGSVLASFDGKNAPYTSLNPVPPALVGKYTVVFPSKEQTPPIDHATYPQGDGIAMLTILNTGGVSFTCTLADGSKTSVAAKLRADHTVPFFRQLYRKRGAIAGDVAFADLPDSDLSGPDLVWLRPELRRARYYQPGWPDGIRVDAVGTKWVGSLDLGQGPADLVNGNASLVFTDGNLASTLIHPVSLDPGGGVIKLVPATTSAYRIESFSGSTGTFAGTFLHSGSTLRSFTAILLNKGANKGGFGFFLDTPPLVFGATGQSGGVSLQP